MERADKNMTKLFYDTAADVGRLKGRRVAIVGYGSSHWAIEESRDQLAREVGASTAYMRLRAYPFTEELEAFIDHHKRIYVVEQNRDAQMIMLLTPDTGQARLYCDHVEPHLGPGKTLMFAHGFNIRFGQIIPPEGIDVSMVAPKAPGHRVREVFEQGGGVPALVAVHQDASGHALDDALAYAKAIGSTRAGALITTFEEETETDLFGEQAVLCGGVSALVKAAFDTLVDAGYQPEVAYFECMHELKLIVDLMYQGGLSYMRYSVSDTAEYGDYVAGPRIVDDHTRDVMRELLSNIRDGSFAREWIAENNAGLPRFKRTRAVETDLRIEEVGRSLRRMMPFVNAKEVLPGAASA